MVHEELAAALGVEPSRAKTVGGCQSTRVSPHAYVMQRRLHIARDLLINQPELTIEHVALRLGFSSSSHFSSTFRRLGRRHADKLLEDLVAVIGRALARRVGWEKCPLLAQSRRFVASWRCPLWGVEPTGRIYEYTPLRRLNQRRQFMGYYSRDRP